MALGNGVAVTGVGAPLDPDGPIDAAIVTASPTTSQPFSSPPDEMTFLDLTRVPDDLDLRVKECGMFRKTPDGDPIVTDELWAEERDHQTTFDQTVEQVRTVEPDRTGLTEIEEIYRRRPDEYAALEREYEHLNVEFGHDGLDVEV